MRHQVSLAIIVAAVVSFGEGLFYLGMSYYFLAKRNKMSERESLEAYIKHKYYVMASLCAFIAVSLISLVTLIEGYHYLLGLALFQAVIFFCLWRLFAGILKSREKELQRILTILNR